MNGIELQQRLTTLTSRALLLVSRMDLIIRKADPACAECGGERSVIIEGSLTTR